MKPMKYNTPKQRLKIYEKALAFYKAKNKIIHGEDYESGICLITAMLISGKPYFNSETPNTGVLKQMLPEFASYYDVNIRWQALYSKYPNQWRIKVLTEIIENLKSK